MSRNQREGRYAGALNGRHYRTRGVNCTVSSIDVCIELEVRRMGDASRLFNRLFADIGLITRIVDRDTPPDLCGDEVVDCDIRGNPITRRMVNAFSKADHGAGND